MYAARSRTLISLRLSLLFRECNFHTVNQFKTVSREAINNMLKLSLGL